MSNKEQSKIWRSENKAHVRSYWQSPRGKQVRKIYIQSDKGKTVANQAKRIRYAGNLANSRSYQRIKIAQLRITTIVRLGGKCKCCGDTQEAFLSLDHHQRNGKEHRASFNNASSLYRWSAKAPISELRAMLRVLCYNCHGAITTRGQCPLHRKLK